MYQLQTLKKCLSASQVDHCLQSLPKTLDDTFSRMLNNVDDLYKSDFIRILQFLTYSERPLTKNEIVDAIAVDTGRRPQFDARNRMSDPEEITTYCPGLVSITRDHKDDRRTEFRLSHFSIKEYLISGRVNKNFRAHLTKTRANAAITCVCVAYLSCLDSRLPISKILDIYPFAHYAAKHWMDHAKNAEHSGVVKEKILSFFSQQKRAYKTWTRILDYGQDFGLEQANSTSNPLYYACLKGLGHTARVLLDRGISTDGQRDVLGSALQAACFGGHLRLVQLLIVNGADVSIRGGLYHSALRAAAEQSHEHVVEFLLKYGADVYVERGGEGDSLHSH